MEPSAAITSPSLSEEELEDLQLFLRDWLRHTGRTQADLRRALRASSIRMPVLVEVLQHIHRQHGLGGLAEQLCRIETIWHGEDGDSFAGSHVDSHATGVSAVAAHQAPAEAMDQLDLLLAEIRMQEERD